MVERHDGRTVAIEVKLAETPGSPDPRRHSGDRVVTGTPERNDGFATYGHHLVLKLVPRR